jgi:RNA polymerase sigma-70 factor (ECF subfamily)
MNLAATSPPPSEEELIAQAQAGDRAAYGELIRRHRKGVVNVVYRMCGDAALAEDAAQETFIRAWEKLGGYKPRSAFRNWLYRIATNQAIDQLRRDRPTVDVEKVPLRDPARGPERSLELNERAEIVRQAVLALPPAGRSALILREYEGLSYQEIADTLEIPIGTVMSRLSYARRRLRETLASYMEVT